MVRTYEPVFDDELDQRQMEAEEEAYIKQQLDDEWRKSH